MTVAATLKETEESKYYLTGSDFSELAILNYSLDGELIKQEDQAKSLKTAKFKKMDWQKIEKNFINKAAGLRFHPIASQAGLKMQKLGPERQSIEELSLSNQNERLTAVESGPSKNKPIDWVSYLPRLRKSLRGLHPTELKGEYWPQKQRTLTYKSVGSRQRQMNNHQNNDSNKRYHQQQLPFSSINSARNAVAAPNFNFADKISRVKLPSNHSIDKISKSSKSPTNQSKSKQSKKNAQTDLTGNQKEADQQHVFIVNEEVMRRKTPVASIKANQGLEKNREGFNNYDQTFYQPGEPVEQTFMRVDYQKSIVAASSKDCTFQTSQNCQFMSPRFSRVENNAQILGKKFGLRGNSVAQNKEVNMKPRPTLQYFGTTLLNPKSSGSTSLRAVSNLQVDRDQTRLEAPSSCHQVTNYNEKDPVSETETLVDVASQQISLNSQLEQYKHGVQQQQSAVEALSIQNQKSGSMTQRANTKSLNDRKQGSKIQPSSLNITQITPMPPDQNKSPKVSPKTKQKVYAGLIQDDPPASPNAQSPNQQGVSKLPESQMQVFVAHSKFRKQSLHMPAVKQSQEKFNVSYYTMKHRAHDCQSMVKQQSSLTGGSPKPHCGSAERSCKQGRLLTKWPVGTKKDFGQCVKELYKQQQTKVSFGAGEKRKGASMMEKHTHNYLNRVERIREEIIQPQTTTIRSQCQTSRLTTDEIFETEAKGLTPSQSGISLKNDDDDVKIQNQSFLKAQIAENLKDCQKIVPGTPQIQATVGPVKGDLTAENWNIAQQIVRSKTKNNPIEAELGIVAKGAILHHGNKQKPQKHPQDQDCHVIYKHNDSKGFTQDSSQENFNEDIVNQLEEAFENARREVVRKPTIIQIKEIPRMMNDTKNAKVTTPLTSKAVKPVSLFPDISQNTEELECQQNTFGSCSSQKMDHLASPCKMSMGSPRYNHQQTAANQYRKVQQKLPLRVHNQHQKKTDGDAEPKNQKKQKPSKQDQIVNNDKMMNRESDPTRLRDSKIPDKPLTKGTVSTACVPSTSGGTYQNKRSHSIQIERESHIKSSFNPILSVIDDKVSQNECPTINISGMKSRNDIQTQLSSIQSRQKSIASMIPDSIKTSALIDTSSSVGPKTKFRSISTRRATEQAAFGGTQKPKRVEKIETILNRIVRAKCCLPNQTPEQLEVMQRALGDDQADYLRSPGRHKAFRVRLKFLQNNFLQNVTEDFMSIQNLERQIDQTIETNEIMFRQFQITDKEEQQLMVRLFKRFFFGTIQNKYGYMKTIKDKAEVSGRLLCSELELNPKVLPLFGVLTVFNGDAMISWHTFLKIMTLFLLEKEVPDIRFEFILRFLKFITNHEDLDRVHYLEEMLNKFQFSKRTQIVQSVPILVFWNKVRVVMAQHRDYIFELGKSNKFDISKAMRVLTESDLTAEDTYPFFDTLFDIS